MALKKQTQFLKHQENIKIRAKINEIITKKGIHETKNWFFEKINKIHQLLDKLKGWDKNTQTDKVRDETRNITTDTNEI